MAWVLHVMSVYRVTAGVMHKDYGRVRFITGFCLNTGLFLFFTRLGGELCYGYSLQGKGTNTNPPPLFVHYLFRLVLYLYYSGIYRVHLLSASFCQAFCVNRFSSGGLVFCFVLWAGDILALSSFLFSLFLDCSPISFFILRLLLLFTHPLSLTLPLFRRQD
jgi:hypothetical protein